MIPKVIQSLGRFDLAFRDAAGCQPPETVDFRLEIADRLRILGTGLADSAKKQKEDATEMKPSGERPMAIHVVFHREARR